MNRKRNNQQFKDHIVYGDSQPFLQYYADQNAENQSQEDGLDQFYAIQNLVSFKDLKGQVRSECYLAIPCHHFLLF
jgi:hypothetical protein